MDKNFGVNFIHISKVPKLSGTEAVVKEIDYIIRELNSSHKTNLYPNDILGSLRPPGLLGYEKLKSLLKNERNTRVNHFFGPILNKYRVLSHLSNPH